MKRRHAKGKNGKNAGLERQKNVEKTQGQHVIIEVQQLIQANRLVEAADILRALQQSEDTRVQAGYLLGCVLFLEQRYHEALACFEEALCAQPDNAIFLNNKAVALEKLGQDKLAEEFFRKAMERKDDYFEPFYNLASLLEKEGRYQEALVCLRQFRGKEESAKAYNLFGHCYEKLNGFEPAIMCYQKALSLDGSSLEAASYLSGVLCYKGRLSEARQILQQVLKYHKTDVALLNNIGQTYLLMGQADTALKFYQEAASNAKQRLPAIESNRLLTLNYLPFLPEHIFTEHQKWGAEYAGKEEKGIFASRAAERRPLRIGYVSPDFYSHSVMYFFEPVLRHHDRGAVEVTLYSAHPYLRDETTQRIRSMADRWRDISRLSNEEAKALILEDGIDILVDLTGHAAKNRLALFALKAAPVQVTWIGYPNTTGLTQMDYRFTDAFADPVGAADERHTEKLIRLPSTFLCYQPREDVEEVADLPAGKRGYITFASFNNLSKISPQLITMWCSILEGVPNSRLVMKARGLGDAGVQQYYTELFLARGISPERVIFLERSLTIKEHFHYYNEVDIALDTFPYHGTTTTCDSLWMGVPVVTMAGSSHVSRVGVSLLENAGLPEFVAANPSQYIQIAVELAQDIERLSKLKRELRYRLKQSPLLDGKAMAKNIESAYQSMWNIWLATQQGVLVKAGASQAIAEREKDEAQRHYEFATRLKEEERWQEAAKEYQKVISLEPNHPEAHASLAAVFYMLGNQEAAYNHYQIALSVNPQNYVLLHNFAILLKSSGKTAEAIHLLEKAIELKPDYLEAQSKLMVFYQQQGEWEKTLSWAQKLLLLEPNNADALKSMGMIYKGRGQRQEAEIYLKKALAVQPEAVDILNTLGNLFTEAGKIQEAMAVFNKALSIKPEEAITYCNLAGCLAKQGKSAETVAYFRKALQLKPDFAKLHSNILLALAYLEETNPSAIYEEHQTWARDYAEKLYPKNLQVQPKEPGARIRIGYVSPDFRNHSVAFFAEPILLAHDRDKFEVVLYSDVKFPDTATKRICGEVEHWRDISCLSDEAVYQQMCQDKIDILVDLAGHTADNRMLVFARKPAPVQITWIGYPNTTGLATMDYRLTDHYADPVGLTEQFHSEKLIRLKHSFLCYRPKADSPEVGELPYLKNGFITFGSFNNFNKVSVKTITLWANILTHVPHSRILIKAGGFADSSVQERTLKAFEQLGIAAERVVMLGQIPGYHEHLAKYNEVDIALDTFPYHGTTTTCEALWMGVPVISLAGNTHVSRVGVSLLTNAGLDNCIAASPEEYRKLAVDMAADIKKLQKIRQSLRKNMLASPLMEAKGFTANLENIYMELWDNYEGGAGLSADYENTSTAFDVTEGLAQAAQKQKAGDLAGAEYLYKRVLSVDGGNLSALHQIALLLYQMGRIEEGIGFLVEAVRILPHNFAAVYNLALLYKENSNAKQALVTFKEAQTINPQHVGAAVNLARAYRDLGKAEEAVGFYQRALNLSPENVDIVNELANVLTLCGQGSQAAALLQQALQKEPQHADILQNLGFASKMSGNPVLALEYYRAALAINPDLPETHSNILSTLNCLPASSKKAVFQEHLVWAKRFADFLPQKFWQQNGQEENRPLKIGYVSGDFREHSVAYFFEAVLKNYNREKFTVYLYNNSPFLDDTSHAFAQMADKWINIYGLSDETAAEQIQKDGIDILVDLAGHTDKHRLLVFARKSAPVQVTWLGYPNTTGLRAMDYRITDQYADPMLIEEDQYYTENLIRMSKCFLCYSPKTAPREQCPAPYTKNDGMITFGSFNNLAKISSQVLVRWGEILKNVPNSRLLLKAPGLTDQDVQQAIQQKLAIQGIDPKRILLYGHKSTHNEHMAMYAMIDIALDTFPYNGTTTTCEALWMGVPVVTVAGDRHVSRVGVSLLKNVGLEKLIARDEAEYVQIATKLAKDFARLTNLHEKITEQMRNSPLMNGATFTKELEENYRMIWEKRFNRSEATNK